MMDVDVGEGADVDVDDGDVVAPDGPAECVCDGWVPPVADADGLGPELPRLDGRSEAVVEGSEPSVEAVTPAFCAAEYCASTSAGLSALTTELAPSAFRTKKTVPTPTDVATAPTTAQPTKYLGPST